MQLRFFFISGCLMGLIFFGSPVRAQESAAKPVTFEDTLRQQYELQKEKINKMFQDKLAKISARTSLPEDMKQMLIRQADEIREFDSYTLDRKLDMKLKQAQERDIIKERLKADATNRAKWILENERVLAETATPLPPEMPTLGDAASPPPPADETSEDPVVSTPEMPSPTVSVTVAPTQEATADISASEVSVAVTPSAQKASEKVTVSASEMPSPTVSVTVAPDQVSAASSSASSEVSVSVTPTQAQMTDTPSAPEVSVSVTPTQAQMTDTPSAPEVSVSVTPTQAQATDTTPSAPEVSVSVTPTQAQATDTPSAPEVSVSVTPTQGAEAGKAVSVSVTTTQASDKAQDNTPGLVTVKPEAKTMGGGGLIREEIPGQRVLN